MDKNNRFGTPSPFLSQMEKVDIVESVMSFLTQTHKFKYPKKPREKKRKKKES